MGSNRASDQAQKGDLSHKMRSQPVILVLLFLAAVCLSTILSYMTLWLSLSQPSLFGYSILLYQLFSFPFSLVCVVWIAARSGQTSWSTWTVPLLLCVAAMLIWMIEYSLNHSTSLNVVMTRDSMEAMAYYFWNQTQRSALFTYVCLAVLFRVSSLHLRPADAESSPRPLTVRSILGLTTVVAIALGMDAAVNRASGQSLLGNSSFLSQYYFLMTAFHTLSMTLAWFSTAWLFVPNNRMRWMGALGIGGVIALLSAYYFVCLPEFYRQRMKLSSVRAFSGSLMHLNQFAVSVFQIGFVFLCVGMIHLAGYRWDILRRMPRGLDKTEVKDNGIPSVLNTTKVPPVRPRQGDDLKAGRFQS